MPAHWKLLAFTAVAAVSALLLIPGGATRPTRTLAADCDPDDTGTLVIEIVDNATGTFVSFGSSRVLVKPSPDDFELDQIFVDSDSTDANASDDRDGDRGVIRLENVCSTESGESYEVSIYSLPGDFEDCDYDVNSGEDSVPSEGTGKITLEVDCTGIVATPTPVATATPSAPATVTANASPLALTCNGTSVVNITVRDAGGNPVKAGVPVTISTTLGAISPSSGHVTNDQGAVHVFLTAPASTGGTATITATSGSATGTAAITINCGAPAATGTTAPLPTAPAGTGVSNVITPPSTGNAGLAQ